MVVTKASLTGQAKWLLVISGIFALSVALSNTFVNVYLWKVDRSYVAIGWYNLAVYCTIPVAFVAAGRIVCRIASVWTLRIGIILHACFYLVALIGGITVAKIPLLLGFVMGLAAGFYWFSFNLLCLRYTASGSREKFYGLNGVMGAVAGIVAPPVSGYLIFMEDRLGGLSGYHVIFSLSLGLFVLATCLSFRLRAQALGRRLELWNVGVTALRAKSWRMVIIGCAVYGLREGVFLFLIGLFMYIATSSELKLGEFILLQSALSSVSFYLVSRFVKPSNRLKSMGTGAVLMACSALIFLLPIQARNILWYGSLIAVSLPLFLVPLQGYVFDGISYLAEENRGDTEHVIIREVFENGGRVIGIIGFLLLVAFTASARWIAYFAIALGFVQLVTFWLIRLGQSVRGGVGQPLNKGHAGHEAAKASTLLRRRKAGT